MKLFLYLLLISLIVNGCGDSNSQRKGDYDLREYIAPQDNQTNRYDSFLNDSYIGFTTKNKSSRTYIINNYDKNATITTIHNNATMTTIHNNKYTLKTIITDKEIKNSYFCPLTLRYVNEGDTLYFYKTDCDINKEYIMDMNITFVKHYKTKDFKYRFYTKENDSKFLYYSYDDVIEIERSFTDVGCRYTDDFDPIEVQYYAKGIGLVAYSFPYYDNEAFRDEFYNPNLTE